MKLTAEADELLERSVKKTTRLVAVARRKTPDSGAKARLKAERRSRNWPTSARRSPGK